MATYIPIGADLAGSLIGERIHAGIRKVSDEPGAPDLWKAIHDNIDAWSDGLGYMLYTLNEAGYYVCKKQEE